MLRLCLRTYYHLSVLNWHSIRLLLLPPNKQQSSGYWIGFLLMQGQSWTQIAGGGVDGCGETQMLESLNVLEEAHFIITFLICLS